MKKIKQKVNYKTLLKNDSKFKRVLDGYESLPKFFSSLKALEKYGPLSYKLKNKFSKKKRKVSQDKPIVNDNIVRYNADYNVGLSQSQVDERIKSGLTNNTKVKSSTSYLSIFVKNIFTFFNLLWLIIAVALLSVGAKYNDLLFLFVIIANTSIAIIQEIRAKIAVEKLSIVTTPLVKTIRDGKITEMHADKLVLDDIILLTSGNHIPADCIIVNA